MMLTLALALMLQAAPSGTPSGALADLQPAFGNTLVSTYPDGRTARLWLAPDGRFQGQGRRKGFNSGVWRIRDRQLCLSQRRPVPLPGSFCTPIVDGGIGASWTAKAVTGETITVRLVSGDDGRPG